MSIGLKSPTRGDKIKMYRCRVGRTMTEVANSLGIELDTYKSYELGELNVPDIIMYKCSKILSAPELMCGLNPKNFYNRRKYVKAKINFD